MGRAPEPFESVTLHDLGGLTDTAGEEVEGGTDAESDAEVGIGVGESKHEGLLLRGAKSDPDKIGTGKFDGIKREVFNVLDVRGRVGTHDVEARVAFPHALGEGGRNAGGSAVEKVSVSGFGGGGADRLHEVGAVDPTDVTVSGEASQPDERHAVGRGEEGAVQGPAVDGVAPGTADGVGIAAAHILVTSILGGRQQDIGRALQIEGVYTDSENIETRRFHRTRIVGMPTGLARTGLTVTLAVLETLDESGGGSVREGCELETGVGEGVVAGARIWHDDDTNAGGVGGKMAGHGVFESQRRGGGDFEGGAGGEVDLGGRFGGGDIITAHGSLKVVFEAEAGEVTVDVEMVRVGRDGEREVLAAGKIQEWNNAGENGLIADDRVFVPLESDFELVDIGLGAKGTPRVKRNAGVANDLLT